MKKYLTAILALQIVTLFFIISTKTEAQTSYLVHNEEPLTLRNTITANQTSDLIFLGAFINGSYQTFATQSGGILELVDPGRTKKELIYYSSATVDQTLNTKDVTLFGVTRGVCPNNATDSETFKTCAAGETFVWARGTRGTLGNTYQLINLTAKRDVQNTMFGSGIFLSNQTTQPYIDFNSVTTAEETAFTVINDGMMWYNETLNLFRGRIGGSNVSFGDTGTVDAGYQNSGKVECGTPAEFSAATASGSSGAPVVPCGSDIIVTSSGTSGRIVATNSDGFIDVTSGGTGTGSITRGSLLLVIILILLLN